ncbi:MAG: MarR family transcriptional regulator [Williamsia herbipolensis]|nr:MarR family transcriptional regulator [Williamsia herbipolensis]
MSQGEEQIDLSVSVGYLLKEASAALRTAMEDVLRPLGMTITQYSCMELLAQRPDLSNSELARGAFVTRQSMNVLLQALDRDGLVTRADAPASGRALPTRLTPAGRRRLDKASAAVRSVEVRMLGDLTDTDRAQVGRLLRTMVRSLSADRTPGEDGDRTPS